MRNSYWTPVIIVYRIKYKCIKIKVWMYLLLYLKSYNSIWYLFKILYFDKK
jgi:hypothetical protein